MHQFAGLDLSGNLWKLYSNAFIIIFHIILESDKIQWQNKSLVSLETNMIWCMQILYPWKSHAAIYNNAIKPLIHHELTFFNFCVVLKSRSHTVACRGVLMCCQLNAMSVVNTFVPDAQFSWEESMISKEEMLCVNYQFCLYQQMWMPMMFTPTKL